VGKIILCLLLCIATTRAQYVIQFPYYQNFDALTASPPEWSTSTLRNGKPWYLGRPELDIWWDAVNQRYWNRFAVCQEFSGSTSDTLWSVSTLTLALDFRGRVLNGSEYIAFSVTKWDDGAGELIVSVRKIGGATTIVHTSSLGPPWPNMFVDYPDISKAIRVFHVVLPNDLSDSQCLVDISVKAANYFTSQTPAVLVDEVFVGGGALPVELSYFDVIAGPTPISAIVKWQTITEVNTYCFFIQRRSEDSPYFVDIYQEKAKGNTLVPQSYSVTLDRNPVTPTNTHYFRLKIVDLDGTTRYSGEARMRFGVPKSPEVSEPYPNPTSGTAVIEYDVSRECLVLINTYDITGKLVSEWRDPNSKPGFYKYIFDGTHLASGTYVVSLLVGDEGMAKRIILLK
jgi:hypothetical protein